MNQKQPKKSIPHPWRKAQNPWERVHLDFAGPFMNSMWMIVVDSYSKWIEVVDMKTSTKSNNVVTKLRTMFSRFGLPKILVSDNGPQLVSAEFESFCAKNGINHVTTPVYHPASNGQVESIVDKFKAAMKKMRTSSSDMGLNLANWLLNYHNTPHSSTGVEPAVLMLGRRIRSALSLIHPLSSSRQQTMLANQEQKVIDSEKHLRRFSVGDPVLYRDTLHKSWHKGTVKETSDKLYIITTADGLVVRKHIDHIVASTGVPETKDPAAGEVRETEKAAYRHGERPNVQIARPECLSKPVVEPVVDSNSSNNCEPSSSTSNAPKSVEIELARPKRMIKAPDRLSYEKLGGQN